MKIIQHKLYDKANTQGYVRVRLNGQLYWEGPNLVTDGGLAYSAKLLAGYAVQKTPTQYETADSILIGNGGADTAGSFPAGLQNTPTVPVPPTRPDTSLVSQILNTPGTPPGAAGAIEAANTAIFSASFQADDYVNGDFPGFGAIGVKALFINEFGLYVSAPISGTPILVARVCVPSIAFAPTSGYTIAVEWTVGYL